MKKTLTMILAFALVFALGVGGTLAWLKDSTTTITNTFSPSTINIALDESDDLDLQMVPGKTIAKDPVVTVEAGSEACWLFVKIEKSENYDTYLNEYAVVTGDNGWTELEDGVYYKEVAASDEDQEFAVLVNDEVTVKTSVTKAQMDALTTEDAYPTLEFTAYAVQSANLDPATAEAAWALAQVQD